MSHRRYLQTLRDSDGLHLIPFHSAATSRRRVSCLHCMSLHDELTLISDLESKGGKFAIQLMPPNLLRTACDGQAAFCSAVWRPAEWAHTHITCTRSLMVGGCQSAHMDERCLHLTLKAGQVTVCIDSGMIWSQRLVKPGSLQSLLPLHPSPFHP